MLREKIKQFKAKLKADKQEVLALSSAGIRTGRKRGAQSLLEESSDEEPSKYHYSPSRKNSLLSDSE